MTGRSIGAVAAAFLAIACQPLAPKPAAAEEGLWTFDAFPSQKVKDAYGFAPDQAWLDHVRLSTGRLSSGCSAGLVSAEGLIQTNHHCMLDCIQEHTPPGGDPLTTPTIAVTRADEPACPALTLEVLTAITDVTAALDTATAGLDGTAYADAFEAERKKIEEACVGDAHDKVCEITALFEGGQQKLHEYRSYDDIRLVLGVEGDVGSFGGDPDNFNFPRYALDVGFLRVYENGRPAATPQFLKWRSTPIEEGELLFTAGSPGETSRHWTVSRVEGTRDVTATFWLSIWSELRGRLIMFVAMGREEKRIATEMLYDVENYYKAWRGEHVALAQTGAMERLRQNESDLRQGVAADPELADEVGPVWDELAKVEEVQRRDLYRHRLIEDGFSGRSELADYARLLVRAAVDTDKDASGGWTATPLDIDNSNLQEKRIEPRLEELVLGFWLSKIREFLTTDDPLVMKMLGRESPEGLARRVVTETRLGDVAERKRLVAGGAKAVMASTDPMLLFIRSFDDGARAIRDSWDASVIGARERGYAKIARARFKLFGDAVYPDASNTPRVSFGSAAGWTEPDGRVVPYATRFSGLFARATGAEPYRLAPLWEKAVPSLDPQTIFNVSTTNDTVGGNSGSPVIDRDGAIVGAMFDGNFLSLGGTYFYDPAVNRTVIVASTAVEEVLVKIYGLQRIVDELKR